MTTDQAACRELEEETNNTNDADGDDEDDDIRRRFSDHTVQSTTPCHFEQKTKQTVPVPTFLVSQSPNFSRKQTTPEKKNKKHKQYPAPSIGHQHLHSLTDSKKRTKVNQTSITPPSTYLHPIKKQNAPTLTHTHTNFNPTNYQNQNQNQREKRPSTDTDQP